MLIGELAQRSGLSRDTLRYYARCGLIQAQYRQAGNGYQQYHEHTLERLAHIQHLQHLGLTLREIRALLQPAGPQHPCEPLPQQLAQKIAALEQTLQQLQQQRDALRAMQQRCHGACAIEAGLPCCVPKPEQGPKQNT